VPAQLQVHVAPVARSLPYWTPVNLVPSSTGVIPAAEQRNALTSRVVWPPSRAKVCSHCMRSPSTRRPLQVISARASFVF